MMDVKNEADKNHYQQPCRSSCTKIGNVNFVSTNETKMATIQQTITPSYAVEQHSGSLVKKFFDWSAGQEKNRFLWLGLILAGHGCVLTPITVMAVLLAGTNMYLFILALVAMGMSLVTNLAAMPTKVTIPVFVLSVIIDISIIFSCVLIGFDISKTYI